ncbi:acyl-CoA thioesterase [Halohasta salina]|uniref:acyl-CoA thioesterase n=1 Tax=Halohasta salina TaxID=2961621 RepID=UPI0020A4CC99|nr:thioesterase family protein [Halohasta salina]
MPSQPFVTQLPVRFRDLDSFGHVNTAVHASYVEEARMAYFEQVVGVDLASVGTVVASLSIDYRRPIEFGDDLAVETRVSAIGTTSLTLDHDLRVDGDVVSTATVVVVRYDYAADEPVAVPEAWRSAIVDFEGDAIE